MRWPRCLRHDERKRRGREIVWSWHPDADAALMRKHHAQSGGQKARRTGEITYKR